jgi:hypothetical protein
MKASSQCPESAVIQQALSDPNFPPAELKDACSASCVSSVPSTIKAALAKVPTSQMDDTCMALRTMLLYSELVCSVGTDGSMCYPKMALLETFGKRPVTQESTAQLCDGGCMTEIAKTYGAIMEMTSPDDENARQGMARVAMMCSKDGNTYCLPQITSLANDFSTANASHPSAALLDKLCSNCARRMYLYMGNEMSALAPALCVKKPNGDRCGTGFDMTALSSPLYACDSVIKNTVLGNVPAGTCPDYGSECSTHLQVLVGQNGCCTGPFLDSAVSVAYAQIFNQTMPEMKKVAMSAFQACAPSIPDMCRGTKKVAARMRIQNLKFDWVNGNADRKAKFIASVQSDIANAVGVPVSAVTINSISSGSVIVDFSIQTSSDEETTAAGVAVEAAVSDGTIDLVSVDAMVSSDPTALVNPSSGLDVTSGSSPPSSAGTQASASVMALVLATAALLARSL